MKNPRVIAGFFMGYDFKLSPPVRAHAHMDCMVASLRLVLRAIQGCLEIDKVTIHLLELLGGDEWPELT
jgi:hypothetical protein